MFFDDLETRNNDKRIADIAEQLPKQIVRAAALSGYNEEFQEVDASAVKTLSDLALLPVLRKSVLTKAQTVGNVLGGFNARKISDFAHIFQSPGPIYEPGGIDKDWWRMGRVLHALGIGPGDIARVSLVSWEKTIPIDTRSVARFALEGRWELGQRARQS